MTQLETVSVLGGLSLAGAVWMGVWSGRMGARARLRRRLGRLAGGAGAGLMRDGQGTSALARALENSGLGWTPGQFVARVVAVVTLGVLVGAAASSAALTFLLAVGGSVFLWLLVRRAQVRRLALCDEQMPQALEIVALALRAGHALPGAMRLAADECPQPLAGELRRVVDENSLGRPMSEVIAAFAKRLAGCDAIETFAVAVLVLQETGGNLITVLERIVESARARASYRGRLRALTAEGRQSAKLLAALPAIFAIMTMSVDPNYTATLSTPGGQVVAMLAVGMWLAGVLWVRRIVRPLG